MYFQAGNILLIYNLSSTLNMLGKIFSRRHFEIYFSQKIRVGISCKLTSMEKVCMKCQRLFAGKNKKKYISLIHRVSGKPLRLMSSENGDITYEKYAIARHHKWQYFIITHLEQPLRKHAYLNILKISPPKTESFLDKNSDIFYIYAQNIDCGYSLEPPC